jgi:hypothetical protein
MKRILRMAIVSVICIPSLSFAAAHGPLPLKKGTYVLKDTVPCEDAPFAAVFDYDGHSLSGPHESRCSSVLLEHHGREYRIRTTCTALGDGTPAPPSMETQSYRLISLTEVAVSRSDGSDELTYRLCPAWSAK